MAVLTKHSTVQFWESIHFFICSNWITNINIGPPHVIEQVFEGGLVGFSKGLPLSTNKNSKFLDNFDYWSYTQDQLDYLKREIDGLDVLEYISGVVLAFSF